MGKRNLIRRVVFLILLLAAAVEAETLCSYEGPDTSEDSFKLTDFTVKGPSNPEVGDELEIEFTITNTGDPVNLSSRGIFAAVRSRLYNEKDIGSVFAGQEMGTGTSKHFEMDLTIDEDGLWKVWPSYGYMKRTYSPVLEQYVYIAKEGPEYWHVCEITVCPSYCDDDVRYYGGYEGQDGLCGYLEETCDYGCNDEGTDCAEVDRIEVTEGPEYSVRFDAFSRDECGPSFNVWWNTNIEADSSVFFRKQGDSWEEIDDIDESRSGDEYQYSLSSLLLLDYDTTYYYYVRSCGPDDCVEMPYESFTTPSSFLQINDIEASATMRTATVSWQTACAYEEASRSAQQTNYTIYVVSTAYAHFDNPPWTAVSNSSFASEHTALLSGMIEEGHNYTFYILACDEYGYCAESERHSFATKERMFPEILDMAVEPSHDSVAMSWNTFRYLNSTVRVYKEGYTFPSWTFLDSDYVSEHSYRFFALEPGRPYSFTIEHCSGIKCNTTEHFSFQTSSCLDRIKNDDEEDMDCGGTHCVACCEDGVQDRGETGVDCGGSCGACDPDAVSLPSQFDWRDVEGTNWVSPVGDQHGCGSCWAFSALGAIEAKYNIEQGSALNIDLSEQYGVSCTDGSCDGGWPLNIYVLMADDGTEDYGMPDESCFPYNASNLACTARCSDWQSSLWRIENYYFVPNRIAEIKEAIILHGPVSMCSNNWNHCVVAVGWNDARASWIVKNSWGRGWGVNGYGMIPYANHEFSDLKNYVSYVEGVNQK